jgi:hypothetical protein
LDDSPLYLVLLSLAFDMPDILIQTEVSSQNLTVNYYRLSVDNVFNIN